MGIRISFLIFTFGAIYSLLAFNLYNIQLKDGSYWTAVAASRKNLAGLLISNRGSIYFTDKSGNEIPAVLNKNYPLIYAIPSEVVKADSKGVAKLSETADALSEITGKPAEELVKILNKKGDPYELILKKATQNQVDLLAKLKLPGIEIDAKPFRFYPLGSTGAHILGYVSTNDSVWRGLYGTELFYNTELEITSGSMESNDIYLTIDRNIQSRAEEILNDLVFEYKAEGGTVIVEDPKTGKILALANNPTFDPNNYGKSNVANFLNQGVQAIYEPGSIFKVITMASGIDAGKITPDTIYVDNGYLTLNGKTIRNWDLKAHGKMTMTNVIEKSLNTGAAFAEKTMGHDIFYEYLIKFGFAEKTAVDLPGEVVGSLKQLEKNARDINFATASFGQGISVTPIKLLSAISAIANHGVMVKPYLNSELKSAPGNRIISAETSRQVVEMMVSAVNKAEVARIKGYTVAGKTGTAQVPDFKNGGYTDEYINTYIGFAPAYDPKFVILIKLNKPEGSPLAGRTVVPAFRNLAEFILNYYNVPPDDINSTNLP